MKTESSIQFRISQEKKELWKKAATKSKKTLSKYIIDAVDDVLTGSDILASIEEMLENKFQKHLKNRNRVTTTQPVDPVAISTELKNTKEKDDKTNEGLTSPLLPTSVVPGEKKLARTTVQIREKQLATLKSITGSEKQYTSVSHAVRVAINDFIIKKKLANNGSS